MAASSCLDWTNGAPSRLSELATPIASKRKSATWQQTWSHRCARNSRSAEIDGHTVVAVELFEIPGEQKPCYYWLVGLQRGAYLRLGNTNRQMTV